MMKDEEESITEANNVIADAFSHAFISQEKMRAQYLQVRS